MRWIGLHGRPNLLTSWWVSPRYWGRTNHPWWPTVHIFSITRVPHCMIWKGMCLVVYLYGARAWPDTAWRVIHVIPAPEYYTTKYRVTHLVANPGWVDVSPCKCLSYFNATDIYLHCWLEISTMQSFHAIGSLLWSIPGECDLDNPQHAGLSDHDRKLPPCLTHYL